MSSWKRNLLKDLNTNKFDYFKIADPWELPNYQIEPTNNNQTKKYHKSVTKIGPTEAAENHAKAVAYFKSTGEWFEGCHLHHKDPSWKYKDKDRYNKWDPNDLIILSRVEHIKLHNKLRKLKYNK